MPEVETVRGPVSDGELGTTLMHEHVFIMQPEALQNYGHAFGPAYWNEQERLDDAVAKLSAVRDAGISTIVDPTAIGLGRYLPRILDAIAAAATQTGAPVMVAHAGDSSDRIHLSHDAACPRRFLTGGPP